MSKYEMDTAVRLNKQALLFGRVLCVDPSSGSKDSMPGIAFYVNGKLETSGVLVINHKAPIQARLRQIMEQLQALEQEFHPHLLLVEKIRGNRAHNYLRWACGCIVAALSCPHVEVCISTWRSYIDKDTYDKSDTHDAEMLGLSMINLAKGIEAPKKVRKKSVKRKTGRTRPSVSRPSRRVRRA